MAKKIVISKEQKKLLLAAWDYCDQDDKSTEFMLQYLSDMANLDYDVVVAYVSSEQAEKDRNAYYNKKL